MKVSWLYQWLRVISLTLFAVAGVWSSNSPAMEEDYAENNLFSRLKDSTVSLSDAIAQAEEESGTALSAKFELIGDDLRLSVCTAQEGLETEAEDNVFSELSGDPTESEWAPEAETIADEAPLERAAMQLAALRLSNLTLAEAIEKAEAEQDGTVYSAAPAIIDGEPVFDVLIATEDYESIHLIVDGLTGDVSRE